MPIPELLKLLKDAHKHHHIHCDFKQIHMTAKTKWQRQSLKDFNIAKAKQQFSMYCCYEEQSQESDI